MELNSQALDLEHAQFAAKSWKDNAASVKSVSEKAQDKIQELKRQVLELKKENQNISEHSHEMVRLYAARERDYSETEQARRDELAAVAAKAKENNDENLEPGSGTPFWDDDHPKDYFYVGIDGKKKFGWEARYEAVSHKLWVATSEKQAGDRANDYLKDDIREYLVKIHDQGQSIEKLQVQLVERKDKYALLKSNNDNVIQELREVSNQRNSYEAALQRHVSAYRDMLDKKDAEKQTLIDTISDLNVVIAERDQSLVNADKEIKAQYKELLNQFNELTDIQKATDEERALTAKEISTLQSKIKSMETQSGEFSDDIARVQDIHKKTEDRSESQIRDQRKMIEELQIERDEINRQLKSRHLGLRRVTGPSLATFPMNPQILPLGLKRVTGPSLPTSPRNPQNRPLEKRMMTVADIEPVKGSVVNTGSVKSQPATHTIAFGHSVAIDPIMPSFRTLKAMPIKTEYGQRPQNEPQSSQEKSRVPSFASHYERRADEAGPYQSLPYQRGAEITTIPMKRKETSASSLSHAKSTAETFAFGTARNTENSDPLEEISQESESASWIPWSSWRNAAELLSVERKHLQSGYTPRTRYVDIPDKKFQAEFGADKNGSLQRAKDGTLPDPLAVYRETTRTYDRFRKDMRIAFGDSKDRIGDEEDQV